MPRMATNKKGLMAMVCIRPAAFFILIFWSSLCQSNDQLIQTKPLLPKDMLISEGGDFALGFFSPTNSSKKLYIGIWYHGIADRTVVWVANRDNPITSPSAKLAITNNSELVLSDSQGHTLWTASGNTSGGAGAASAVLLSSGNFVLRSPNGTEVWQSFDHPTDTILPTMRILLSYKAQPATHLFAWKGPDDPSTGDIFSGLDPTNLQMFIWKGGRPYYRFPVVNGISVAGGMYQQSNGNSDIMYETRINAGDEFYYTFTVSPGSPYMRFSFDYTGMARLLSWNSTTSSWAVINEYPRSCDLYASCGPFSYCDRIGATPTTCRCLDGFELLDSLNFSTGCQRKEELKCGTENYFMTMPNMKIPDKFLQIKNRTFDQCADECTRNCSCVAYAYANLSSIGAMGDTSRCLVWSGDLIDMEKNSFSEALYIRLGGSPASARKSMLQWPTRFKIIQGVARGIMYLHHDSRLTVIHRDIKASNILLDKEMNPKISDFGMARIFCGDQLQANTNRVVGTYGYMSPEYAMEGAFSVKSDTYSFGILILEIVSGLKISSPHLIMDFSNLITFAWSMWKDGKTVDFFDSSVTESCSLDEVARCIHIGLLCVQDDPSCRPLMSTVVSMLENKATLLPTPKQPIHFALWDYKLGNEGDHRELSVNDISLTMVEGR